MPETEEERRLRKERERKERESETPEQRAARKAREAERDSRKKEETPEERAARKERERKEKETETPEQRAARKAREAERDAAATKKEETPEERAARKERERKERESETPEERAARKAREAERDARARKEETPEERAARKERERKERENETPEERAARKAREAERDTRRKEETPEERAARKAKEDAEKQQRDKREVVHKPLPQTLQKQQQAATAVPVAKPEPVVQGRPGVSQSPAAKKDDDEDGYDDDFVDGFEVEQMLEAQKAVEAENAALRKGPTNASSGTSATGGGAGASTAAPAFVGQSRFGVDDLQRQKYRAQFEKDLARATALRRLVDLDDVSAVIADIPPLSEYDLYLRNFGGSGRQPAACQAPPLEDKIDVEVQADRVTTKSKGGQAPEDLGLFPERMQISATYDAAGATSNMGSAGNGDSGQDGAASGGGAAPSAGKKGNGQPVDATQLSNFLMRVFPVMRTLLDEAQVGGIQQTKSTLSFTSTFITFTVRETIQRPVVRIAYSPVAPQYVLSLHGIKPKTKSSGLPADRYDGLAVIWNRNDPTHPDKILVHGGPLTAGCFSPSRAFLVYAGTASGSVCVWDLREPDTAHATDDKMSTATLRCPSFSSDWQGSSNHDSPVVALSVVGYNSVVGSRKEESDQLISMDQRGTVFFWVVNDGDASGNSRGGTSGSASGSGGGGSSPTRQTATKKSGAGGDQQDHGQLLASCVRVFRASSMSAVPRNGALQQAPSGYSGSGGSLGNAATIAVDLDLCPADPSRFVVAVGSSIEHLSRFSSITAPSHYASSSQFFGDATTCPTCVAFSTLDSRLLLGGYADGTVRVYLREDGAPQLAVIASTAPIRQVRSSASMKLISYALDEKGIFYILDHAVEEREESVVHCPVGTAETGRCTAFDVPPEDKTVSQLLFGFENGSLQLHIIQTQQWMSSSRNDRWL